MQFSNRLSKIHPSETLEAKQRAMELKAKGIPVIDLSAGEPGFSTPTKIKEACKKALDENWTRYGPTNGLKELREAIAQKLKRISAIERSSEEIVVTCGVKQAVLLSLQVLINEGDEVLLPSPYWVSYPAQILLAGGQPVYLQTDMASNFKVTPHQLKGALTPKTKLLILNTPSNPTGACYTEGELKALGEVLGEKNVWILSDEIYEELVFDGFKQTCFLKACPKLKEKTILVNGASKAYAMTGWRMGYALGPKNFIEKLKIVQGQAITSIPTFIQRACVTAFQDCDAEVAQMRSELEKRRNILYEGLLKIEGVKCLKPKGAFYLFPDMRAFSMPSQKLADYLLDKAYVCVVAGQGFGAEGFLRISFVADVSTLKEGIERIKKALTGLRTRDQGPGTKTTNEKKTKI